MFSLVLTITLVANKLKR